jgi:hypothetical protein
LYNKEQKQEKLDQSKVMLESERGRSDMAQDTIKY